MSAAILFDTSVYIGYIRRDAHADLIERAGRSGRVRLSAVVLAELYAGTRTKADKSDLDRVAGAYDTLGFLIAPGATDWARAGQAIRRYRALHGDLDEGLHYNDLLILLCGAKADADVLTENGRDFLRWAGILRRMGVPCRVRVLRSE